MNGPSNVPFDDWTRATREGRSDDVLSGHAADVVLYDVLPPLHYTSASEYRASWDNWRPDTQGAMRLQLDELEVRAGDDAAFAFGLLRCGGTLPDGKTFSDGARHVLPRQGRGRWRVVHQHLKPLGRRGPLFSTRIRGMNFAAGVSTPRRHASSTNRRS